MYSEVLAITMLPTSGENMQILIHIVYIFEGSIVIEIVEICL